MYSEYMAFWIDFFSELQDSVGSLEETISNTYMEPSLQKVTLYKEHDFAPPTGYNYGHQIIDANCLPAWQATIRS